MEPTADNAGAGTSEPGCSIAPSRGVGLAVPALLLCRSPAYHRTDNAIQKIVDVLAAACHRDSNVELCLSMIFEARIKGDAGVATATPPG
jgi:hypothetical protein